jgi:hypothetical protein
MDYPSGKRLESNYKTFPGGIQLPAFRTAMAEDAIGFAVAAEIQAHLPKGFVLQRGRTTNVLSQMHQPEELRLQSATDDPHAAPEPYRGKYLSLYRLEYHDVPLAEGSDYLAILSEDGRLLATRERGLPTEVDATEPTITLDSAKNVAIQDAIKSWGTNEIEIIQSLLEIWVDENQKGRLAWKVILESPDLTNPKGRQYWIAAIGEAEVIYWETTIYHTHFGTVGGNLWKTSPLRGTWNQPLVAINVNRIGAGGGTVTTGPDGRYGFTSGSGNANIKATLRGPHVNIQNMAGSVLEVNRNGSNAAPVDLNFESTEEFTLAQVSAFYWTNFAYHLAGSSLAVEPHHQMPTRVNINGSCNAFYRLSDKSINFYRAGGACPNMAYPDVVLHEYGHYIDHVNGGILDGGLSEGFADAFSILGTHQPCCGRDFRGANTCLRLATDIILWPPTGGIYAQGQCYAGFIWELVEQLKKRYAGNTAFEIATQLLLATLVANPSSIPDAVHLAFLLDDDDGDLTNGTIHFRELAKAADSRNLPRPPDPVLLPSASSAQFPWQPVKKVSSNSNILQAQIRLNQAAEVHISANSSARTVSDPLMFTTGLYNRPEPNAMWTGSLRRVSLQDTAHWTNFGTNFAIMLAAGTHTIYWKIWVTGGEIEFSSGSLLIEAFGTSNASLVGAAVEPQVSVFQSKTTVEEPIGTQRLDDNNPEITVFN